MFKNKYQFNPETLSYDKIELSRSQKIFKYFLLFLGVLISGSLLSLLIFWYFFDTTSYQSMQREKKLLQSQYQELNKKLEKIEGVLAELEYRDDDIYRTMFNADPIPQSVRNAGYGGSDKYKKLRGFDNSPMIIATTKKIDQIAAKLNVQAVSYDEVYKLALQKSKELEAIPAIAPVSTQKTHISSFFGYRFHPILKRKRLHEGLDFAGNIGTEIYATGNGVVKESGFSGGYGRIIKIDHGFGYVTYYAHLKESIVKKGQKVKRGQLIGYLGNSGLSTGPHLHYEVHKDNVRMNPLQYYFSDLTPEEFNALAEIEEKSKLN